MYLLSGAISQRGDSPFVYRDRGGWPASLPYICKIRISMAIGTQSGIRLHERVPMAKIWGSSKNVVVVVVVVLLQFRLAYLNNQRELRNETLCTDRYP